MIINWVEVLPPEDPYADPVTYIVGAVLEERLPDYVPLIEAPTVAEKRASGLDPNESGPCHVELKVYPRCAGIASELSVHFLWADPTHPEHAWGVQAIPQLIKAVHEIKGFNHEGALDLLYGRVIEPVEEREDFNSGKPPR
jgi:hypothetical protein